jgi:transposase
MAFTYSQDLRDRVLAAYDRGMATREIAHTFQVSPAWARRVRQTRREEDRTTPLPRGGVRVIKIDMERLAELVREQPDATLLELRDRLGIDCSESAMSLAVRRLGFTFKKRRSMQRNRIGLMSPSGVNNGKPSK